MLTPANEVLGKVMLLHLCVILFTGGLHPAGNYIQGVCIQGGLHSRGSASTGSASKGVGQAPPPWNTTGYGQRGDGTHPTGMHSCNIMNNSSNFSTQRTPETRLSLKFQPLAHPQSGQFQPSTHPRSGRFDYMHMMHVQHVQNLHLDTRST